uniref:Pco131882 n=1 Tax=Arundo donax TaxID=35708 RepID=A0A0A9HNY8_ARUDO
MVGWVGVGLSPLVARLERCAGRRRLRRKGLPMEITQL